MLDGDRIAGPALVHDGAGDPQGLVEIVGLADAVFGGRADDGVVDQSHVRLFKRDGKEGRESRQADRPLSPCPRQAARPNASSPRPPSRSDDGSGARTGSWSGSLETVSVANRP